MTTEQEKQREGTHEDKEESGPGQQAARDDNDLNVKPDHQGLVPAVWGNCETFRG